MNFLAKFGSISNRAAALTVFFAWYIAAAITTAAMQGKLVESIKLYGGVLLVVAVFMTLVFIVSQALNRMDVVDAAWGPAFIVAAFASYLNSPYDTQIGLNVQTLVTVLVVVWGVRLAYVIIKRLRTKPEDKRYVELRSQWKGNEALNSYLRIFLVQAGLAWIISSAVIHINFSLPQVITGYAVLGLVVWCTGFFFEVIGDWQLKKFLQNPANKGKIMARGLWRYTRHPNYFGEATMWWGIFIIALSTPYGWLGILTPVIITYLLLFVSGVPMTEKAFENKPGWAVYKKRVSIFFPLPPK